MTLLRHLLAIAVLPFTVTVLIPLWVARNNGTQFALGSTATAVAIQTLGAVLLAIGLRLFVASLSRFATEGRGTLAPWDPPRELVVTGPYRYVRNPMISGVVLVLFGEAAVLCRPATSSGPLCFSPSTSWSFRSGRNPCWPRGSGSRTGSTADTCRGSCRG